MHRSARATLGGWLLSGERDSHQRGQRGRDACGGGAQGARLDEKNTTRMHQVWQPGDGGAGYRHERVSRNGLHVLSSRSPYKKTRRRAAEGVSENLAARDQRDSQRAAAPLMIALGAKVINNSQMTSAQTSSLIIDEVKKKLAERGLASELQALERRD